MILVDSSVWVDYFNSTKNEQTDFLFDALVSDTICLGDLILAEVIQGFRSDKDYNQAKELLLPLPIYQLMTPELALVASANYRNLQKKALL